MQLKIKDKPLAPLDLKEFMVKWNMQYPFDRWWRQKHEIAFGSKAHREANFIDMITELHEDLYFRKIATGKDEQSIEDMQFTPAEEAALGMAPIADKKVVKMSKKEIDDEFDNIDLNNVDL